MRRAWLTLILLFAVAALVAAIAGPPTPASAAATVAPRPATAAATAAPSPATAAATAAPSPATAASARPATAASATGAVTPTADPLAGPAALAAPFIARLAVGAPVASAPSVAAGPYGFGVAWTTGPSGTADTVWFAVVSTAGAVTSPPRAVYTLDPAKDMVGVPWVVRRDKGWALVLCAARPAEEKGFVIWGDLPASGSMREEGRHGLPISLGAFSCARPVVHGAEIFVATAIEFADGSETACEGQLLALGASAARDALPLSFDCAGSVARGAERTVATSEGAAAYSEAGARAPLKLPAKASAHAVSLVAGGFVVLYTLPGAPSVTWNLQALDARGKPVGKPLAVPKPPAMTGPGPLGAMFASFAASTRDTWVIAFAMGRDTWVEVSSPAGVRTHTLKEAADELAAVALGGGAAAVAHRTLVMPGKPSDVHVAVIRLAGAKP